MFALAKYLRWDVVAMFVAMGIILTFELLGIFKPQFVTITAIIRAYLPKWLRAMILGWLCYHFMIE